MWGGEGKGRGGRREEQGAPLNAGQGKETGGRSREEKGGGPLLLGGSSYRDLDRPASQAGQSKPASPPLIYPQLELKMKLIHVPLLEFKRPPEEVDRGAGEERRRRRRRRKT